MAPQSRTGAAVKADAYGLGAIPVAQALYTAGCRDFFVAQAQEGAALRPLLEGARIYVLGGLCGNKQPDYVAHGLVPVFNEPGDLWNWHDMAQPFALHFDTGMNRLGFPAADAEGLARRCLGSGLALVMSHLACADETANATNDRQLARFGQAARHFPGIAKSFANSGGVFCGPRYHFDLLRPGIALYGGAPFSGAENPMQPVAVFEARILQIRTAKAGETVGYGATQVLARDSKIAIAGAGYADGVLRSASGRAGGGGFGFLAGKFVPIAGRVSMDLTAFDVTEIPEAALANEQWIEFFGRSVALDSFAQAAGTISYEVLTGIGRRAERVYV